LIARCRAKSLIVQLNEERRGRCGGQRGVRGHVVVYPQRPEALCTILPPAIDEISHPICVLFVGGSPPSLSWLKEHARPLCVRGDKVRSALKWLKNNNPLYVDVQISEENLRNLPSDGIPAIPLEFVQETEAYMSANSEYQSSQGYRPFKNSVQDANPSNLPLESLVVSDVEGHASPPELRSAAMRHMLDQKGFIQVPHGSTPESDIHNTDLLPNTYPTLFPYGIGGFEDPRRQSPLSFKRQAKH
ncbi:hypothetical protein BDN72DRAFT_749088, partial [Pluteus cervinus]